MYIQFERPIHHWNYFLSVENEFINTLKYVEFDLNNKSTFSVEFTKLLLTSAAEVDVVIKQICLIKGLKKKIPNFGDYFKVVKESVPTLISESMTVEQYAIKINPFENWSESQELGWHKAYNHLKHNRGLHFKEGNWENALYSLSALYTSVIHYYKVLTEQKNSKEIRISDVTNSISPKPNLIKYSNEWNHNYLLN